jgi:hypothetical protein
VDRLEEEDLPRLDELDADEMFEVGRALNPALSREAFDRSWAEFCELKRQRALS